MAALGLPQHPGQHMRIARTARRHVPAFATPPRTARPACGTGPAPVFPSPRQVSALVHTQAAEPLPSGSGWRA